MRKRKNYPFHSIEEEAEFHPLGKRLPKKHIPAYELAFSDQEFLLRPELRSIRLQLEYLKAEMTQLEQKIESTIVVFGSARVISREEAKIELQQAKAYRKKYPNDPKGEIDLKKANNAFDKSIYYEKARELAKIISTNGHGKKPGNFVVMTGGGPGIMEAANRGAHEANKKSIGLSIFLPSEEGGNKYIDPELHLQFHYFAIRKMHFLIRARALVVFPGGFGTLDELFEALTLMQTKKIKRIPVLLFNKKYWNNIINFQGLVDAGTIASEDQNLLQFVESPEEAWDIIRTYYSQEKKTTSS